MVQLATIGEIYSNEQLFLLLLTRVYFSSSGIDELKTFVESRIIDWELAYKIAGSHSIRPFVCHVLLMYKLDVPAQFQAKLQRDYQLALQKNIAQALVTAEVTRDLKAIGFDVISYKGASLAARYYDNPAMRQSVDIDFIADEKDIAGIEDYLIGKGYQVKEGVPRRYLAFYTRFFKDIVYRSPKYEFNIEIHWSMLNRFAGKYPAYDFFKTHTTSYQTKYGEYNVLSSSYDFLATVSNHLVKDMGTRFKYMVDISCILSKYPNLLDDPVILETAEKYGFKKRLKKGLSLVNELIGIPIPGHYTSELTLDDLAVPLAYPKAVGRFQFNEPLFIKRSLALQDNLGNKIRLLLACFTYFFIPSYLDINRYRLPAIFLPVLFVLRPFRLLAQKIRPDRTNAPLKKN